MKRRLVYWYMGRVAGHFCPCEWGRFQNKHLVRWCGLIDDAYEEMEKEKTNVRS